MLNTTKMASCYTRDIEKYWKYKESQRHLYGYRSPQLPVRRHLIDWLQSVSKKISLSVKTVHLAIYILDTFMDRHSVTKDRLGFVALVSLMLAAKFEEVDSKVPKISELNQYDGPRYSNKEFIKLEVILLRFIDFGLMQPTVAHFVEYYAIAAVIPSDLKSQRTSFNSLLQSVKSIINDLLDISLREVQFLRLPPSLVAAACVLCARRRLRLRPAWTPAHVALAGYSQDGLGYCAGRLARKYNESLRIKELNEIVFQSPDHGYMSDA